MVKEILTVIKGMPASDGAGVKLHRALGQPKLETIDPFLMLDEIKSDVPGDYIAGFPSHPHKGFETLTYLMHGSMEHKDSTGGQGLIASGGVQYMTAGRGIIHSETPKQDNGLLWGFQLWINLPADQKLIEASYQDIPKENIPIIKLSPKDSQLKLIAGIHPKYDGVGPVVRNDIDLHILDVTTIEDDQIILETLQNHRGFIYVYKGVAEVNGCNIEAGYIAQLGDGTDLTLNLSQQSGILIVFAKPIDEPIVKYGPFVMNTVEEIEQAIRDYQEGKFV